jgi:hypothetical protein
VSLAYTVKRRVEEVLAQLRHRDDLDPGLRRDVGEHGVDLRLGLGRDDEPHVQRVRALVVVRDLAHGAERRCDLVEAVGRHLHRAEHVLPAGALDLEERAETREHAVREELLHTRDQVDLVDAHAPRGGPERACGHGESALQLVDDAAVGLVEDDLRHEPPPSVATARGRAA